MWTIMLCFLLLTSPMSLHRSACQTYSIYSSSWSPACRREKLSETEWGVRVETECGWDNMEPHGTQILLSLPCANLSGETKVAMLGQSLYIKSCKPGQLTLVWEMGGDKRGGSWECVCWVTEGKRKGKCVCVWGFKLQKDRESMFVSASAPVFVQYLFVISYDDKLDPGWQGLCYSTKGLC